MNFDFADILLEVVETGASDLHLTAGAPPMVRERGRLRALDYPPLAPQDTREIVYSILNNEQRKRLETDWQIDLSYSIPNKSRFRVNAFFQRASIGAVLRTIPSEIPRLEELGLPAVLLDFTRKPRGFVLVTGPTGSGKSTSLAAMVDRINEERHEHILTIEDQRELGTDATTFAEGLKSALRQDPDVILVGEMRDLETMATALTAAETGHLVFATLHTQDTAQTVDRIVDAFPPSQQHQVRVQLSVSLQGIVTQQLLPTADGRARVAACEVLVPTPGVRNLILEGKTHQIYSALQTGGAHGMQTMDAALVELVRRGAIPMELAERRSSTPEEMRRLMAGGPGAPAQQMPPMQVPAQG